MQDLFINRTSGTFQLAFNSNQFLPNPPFSATNPDNAAAVEAAINSLPNIALGGGSVKVIQIGQHYFIYFNNPAGAFGSDPLAYVAQNLLAIQTGGPSGGITAFISNLIPGGNSTTTVAAGATLQVQNANNTSGFVEGSGKSLHLNGTGFNGNGAIENVLGLNTWGSSNVTLDTDATIGVDDTSSLTIAKSIGDNGIGKSVHQGRAPERSIYSGDNTTSNTYTGLTNVTAGVLQLNKTLGGVAVAGNLTVGSPTPNMSTYLTQTQTLTFNNFTNLSTQKYTLSVRGQPDRPVHLRRRSDDRRKQHPGLPERAAVRRRHGQSVHRQRTAPGVFAVTFNGVTNAMNGTTWPQILGFRDAASTTSAQSITTASSTSNPLGIPALEQVQILAGQTNEITPSATVTVTDGGELIDGRTPSRRSPPSTCSPASSS